jgi:hypothetical protein
VVLAVLAGVAAAVAAEPRLEVSVQPPRFGVEDRARLVIRVVEPQGDVSQPELGELVNLEVAGGPTRGSEFSFVNGVATSSVSFTYLLQAVDTGAATVGVVSVEVGDSVMRSNPVSVEVVPGSVQPPRGRRRSPFFDDPFEDLVPRRRMPRAEVVLRHLIAAKNLTVGEPVAAAVVLDTTTDISSVNWQTAPTYPGWWAQPVERRERVPPELVEVDGKTFSRFTILRHVLVPLRPEKLVIPPVTARIGVRSRSIFSPGDVMERTSPAIEIEVAGRPPPPEGYAGAVGRLEYSVDLAPAEIDFGASAVLSVRLEGEGNLPLVEEPPVWPRCEGCDVYPPEEESRVTVDERGIHGSRTWRMTLVPRVHGTLTMEPVSMAVFDPKSSRYRHTTLGPLSLEVAPPPATPTPVRVADDSAGEVGPTEATPEKPAAGRPQWRWIAVALLAGLLIGGLVVWWSGRRRSSVIPRRRDGQSPSERARALQLALERWWLDARARGPSEELEREMEALRRDLEAVRFAPGRADHTETIVDLEERLRRLIRGA